MFVFKVWRVSNMVKAMLLLWLISFESTVKSKQNYVFPTNTVVVTGNQMSMTCGSPFSNSTIQWKFRNVNEHGESYVYDGTYTFDGFSALETTNESGKMVILSKNNTRPEDAGTYKCSIRLDGNLYFSAELVVLISDPTCNTSYGSKMPAAMEGANMNIWCEISFLGNLDPVTVWLRDNSDIQTHIIETSNAPKYKTIIHRVKFRLNASDNGKAFRSISYFNISSIRSSAQQVVSKATDVPDYAFAWNFTATVWHGPRNISIEPLKTQYQYGDSLKCRADGNPLPIYKWISTASDDVMEGSTLIISNTIESGSIHHYECLAFNRVSGLNISRAINITVSSYSASESISFSQRILLLSILLPFFGFLILLNFGVILQKHCTRGKTSKYADRDDVQEQTYDEIEQNTFSASISGGATRNLTLVETNRPTFVAGETQQEMETPAALSYSNLVGARRLPVIPFYIKLESTYSQKNDTDSYEETDDATYDYVNDGGRLKTEHSSENYANLEQ